MAFNDWPRFLVQEHPLLSAWESVVSSLTAALVGEGLVCPLSFEIHFGLVGHSSFVLPLHSDASDALPPHSPSPPEMVPFPQASPVPWAVKPSLSFVSWSSALRLPGLWVVGAISQSGVTFSFWRLFYLWFWILMPPGTFLLFHTIFRLILCSSTFSGDHLEPRSFLYYL